MSRPVAARVLEALGAAFRDRAGEQLEPLVEGLAVTLVDVDELVQPTDRGVAAAWDLDATPDPAWLGEATGTPVPAAMTVEQQREYVRQQPRHRRGTPAAIKAAVAAVITGTRRVDLVERADGRAWRVRVQTYAAETVEPAVVLAAATTQTPVGVRVVTEVLTGASYDHITAEHGSYDDVLGEFGTYDAPVVDGDTLLNHVPEPGTES